MAGSRPATKPRREHHGNLGFGQLFRNHPAFVRVFQNEVIVQLASQFQHVANLRNGRSIGPQRNLFLDQANEIVGNRFARRPAVFSGLDGFLVFRQVLDILVGLANVFAPVEVVERAGQPAAGNVVERILADEHSVQLP